MNEQFSPEIIYNSLSDLGCELYLYSCDKSTYHGDHKCQRGIHYNTLYGIALTHAFTVIGSADDIHDIFHEYGDEHGQSAGYDHDHHRHGQFSLKGSNIMTETFQLLKVKGFLEMFIFVNLISCHLYISEKIIRLSVTSDFQADGRRPFCNIRPVPPVPRVFPAE